LQPCTRQAGHVLPQAASGAKTTESLELRWAAAKQCHAAPLKLKLSRRQQTMHAPPGAADTSVHQHQHLMHAAACGSSSRRAQHRPLRHPVRSASSGAAAAAQHPLHAPECTCNHACTLTVRYSIHAHKLVTECRCGSSPQQQQQCHTTSRELLAEPPAQPAQQL
jgi:hypothetical protein